MVKALALCFLHDLAASMQSDGIIDIVVLCSNWANAVPSHVPLMHASHRLSYAAVSVSISPAFYQISVLTDDQIAYNEK